MSFFFNLFFIFNYAYFYKPLTPKIFMQKSSLKGVKSELQKILKVANELSYLWESGNPLYGKNLKLTEYFVSQDETWHMSLKRKENKFYFESRYGDKPLSA